MPDVSASGTRVVRPLDGSAVEGLAGFAHQLTDIGGVRLHAVVGGEGPVLVLLHGWPFTWREWRLVLPSLAEHRTLLVPDLRGLGDSDRPDSGYRKDEVAQDVRAQVADLRHRRALAVPHEQLDLVGTDIGMMVAVAWAADHPAEIRRLVLAESLVPGFGLEELMNPATGGYWHFGFHMQVDVATMLTAGKEAEYLGANWQMMSTGGLSTADRESYLAHYRSPGGMRAGFQHYGTLLMDGEHNRAAINGALPMPVLVLNAEHGIPQQQTLAGVRRIAPAATADLVPDAGHAFAADNASWTVRRLVEFLVSP